MLAEYGETAMITHSWEYTQRHSQSGNSMVVSQKVKHRVTMYLSNSPPRCVSKTNEKNVHTKVNTNVHGSEIPKSPKVETTHMSFNRWPDKQNVGPYNGVLFNHKKEWSTEGWMLQDEGTLKTSHEVKETRHKIRHILGFHLCEISVTGRFTATESTWGAANGWGKDQSGSDCSWVYGFYPGW